MTIDEARTWLQRHADNTPMPGAREAHRIILEELERTRWIPVAERTPENKRLLCTDWKAVSVAMLTFGDWVLSGWHLCSPPTHRMLLPEPPGVE